MQRDAEALVARPLAEPQHRRIIAADLGAPSALGRRAIKVLEDERRDRVHAVVDADGQHVHQERVLLGRVQAQLRRAAKQQRPDVHCGAGAVRRYELGVERHGQVHAFVEVLGGYVGDANVRGRVLHALGVLLRPEDVD